MSDLMQPFQLNVSEQELPGCVSDCSGCAGQTVNDASTSDEHWSVRPASETAPDRRITASHAARMRLRVADESVAPWRG